MPDRLTILFSLGGLIAALLLQASAERAALPLQPLLSIAKLLPVCAGYLAWKSRREHLALRSVRAALLWSSVALPYPYTLALSFYMLRSNYVPEPLQDSLNDPTAFQMFIGLLLVCSLPWTAFALTRMMQNLTGRPPEQFRPLLRRVTVILFILTGVLLSLLEADETVSVFQHAVEPLAAAAFSSVCGYLLTHVHTEGTLLSGLRDP